MDIYATSILRAIVAICALVIAGRLWAMIVPRPLFRAVSHIHPAPVRRQKARNISQAGWQTPLFIGLILVIVISGRAELLSSILAWVYVGLRAALGLAMLLFGRARIASALALVCLLLLAAFTVQAARGLHPATLPPEFATNG